MPFNDNINLQLLAVRHGLVVATILLQTTQCRIKNIVCEENIRRKSPATRRRGACEGFSPSQPIGESVVEPAVKDLWAFDTQFYAISRVSVHFWLRISAKHNDLLDQGLQGAHRTLKWFSMSFQDLFMFVFQDFPGPFMSIYHVFPGLFNRVDNRTSRIFT